MNKELQDLAWSILPKEFKEEVKKEYLVHHEGGDMKYSYGYSDALTDFFGLDNLTSDAEGEDEMLYVSRKQIDALQGEIFKAIMDAHDADDWQDAAHYILDVMPRSFAAIFGSKCLPDEHASKEPKPAEPKFKVNDVVRTVFNEITHITSVLGNGNYYLYGMGNEYPEDSLTLIQPYAEPAKEGTRQEQCVPQNAESGTHSFNHILKDGFREHNRLHIAAILAAGMLASEVRCYPVDRALELADQLIAACEKGGDNA